MTAINAEARKANVVADFMIEGCVWREECASAQVCKEKEKEKKRTKIQELYGHGMRVGVSEEGVDGRSSTVNKWWDLLRSMRSIDERW